MMTPEYRQLLVEHLKSVGQYSRGKTIAERYAAKKSLDETFGKIVSFPNMNEDDIKALDEVTRYLESK